MAQTIHLTLKVGDEGGKQIKGDSTQTQPNKADTIEVFALDTAVRTPINSGTGKATGRREHKPLRIRKRIDKSTPRIAELMALGSVVYCKFDFWRPTADEAAADELYYSVELRGATVCAFSQHLPDVMTAHSEEAREAYELVEFSFDKISWNFEGEEPDAAEDSWSGA